MGGLRGPGTGFLMSLKNVNHQEGHVEEVNYPTEHLVRSYLVDNQWSDTTLQREEQQQQEEEDMLQEGLFLWGLLRNLHATPQDSLLLPASLSPPLLPSHQEVEEQLCEVPVSWESSSSQPSTWTHRGNTFWSGELWPGVVAAQWEPLAVQVVVLTSTLGPFFLCRCPSPSRSTTGSPLPAWVTAPTLTQCSS